MKKVVVLLFAVLLCCTACTVQKPVEDQPHEKETVGMSQFEISYYWGPHGDQMIDESFWQAIAECGFTSVPLENNSTENNKIALGLMKKYGLTCSGLWDSRLNSLANSEGEIPPQEEIDAVVQAVIDDYKDFDNIIGWWLCDEPHSSRFERLGKVQDAIRRLDPGRETLINLFPNYAVAGRLGNMYYEDHLKQFIETVNPSYVSYDHYSFIDTGSRQGFFSNLEQIRTASLEHKLDFMTIILLTKHMNYQDLSYGQILWEVNMPLAYGAKRVSYFTFILDWGMLEDGWTNSCMSYTGEKYPHYYDVQKINVDLLPLGRELFSKNSEAVFHVTDSALEPGCVRYTSYGKLGAIDGSRLVLGFFDDGSIFVVNKGYKGSNTFRLPDVKSGLEYFDCGSSTWKNYETKNADGVYEITLDPGAGILLRIK